MGGGGPMEGTFEEHKPGSYIVQSVEENDWLNEKLESQQYGIYYSVKFEGAAETYLIQAKTAPVEGEKLYGHVEKSSSGKSWRFKKDKQSEDPRETHTGPQAKTDKYLRDVTSIPLDVYRVRANITGLPGTADVDPVEFWEGVRSDAEELLKLIENIRND